MLNRYFLKRTYRVGLIGLAILISLLISQLTACAPEFDWRVYQDRAQGQAYNLQFPGKAATASRELELAGVKVNFTLQGVQAGGMQFVLGHAAATSAAQAKEFADSLRTSFANNSSVPAPQSTAVQLPNTLGAWDVHIKNATTTGAARFIWTQTAVYELIVLSPTGQWSPEAAEQFIRSLSFE